LAINRFFHKYNYKNKNLNLNLKFKKQSASILNIMPLLAFCCFLENLSLGSRIFCILLINRNIKSFVQRKKVEKEAERRE